MWEAEEREYPEIPDDELDECIAAWLDAATNPDLPRRLRREAEEMLRHFGG